MAKCRSCGKKIGFLQPELMCDECTNRLKRTAQTETELNQEKIEKRLKEICSVTISTETAINWPVTHRFGLISSERVLGINILEDVAGQFRDIVGGRSQTYENHLIEAKQSLMNELKSLAFDMGANYILGAGFQFNEISGQGKSMLLIALSGTAVKVQDESIQN